MNLFHTFAAHCIPNSANLQSFKEKIGYLKFNVCILRRIPRGARISVANKLNKVIIDH
jgi:hypothetical protein